MNKFRIYKWLFAFGIILLLAITAYSIDDQLSFAAKKNHQQKINTLFSKISAAEDSKRPFKIVFYGQSIIEKSWWKSTANAIQAQYPNVKFEITNKAIGAHTAERLVRLVDDDVIALHPDLVIFQVYGEQEPYEEIIKKIKFGTDSEILIATDHIGAFDDVNEETNPKYLFRRNVFKQLHNKLLQNAPKANWIAWKNYVFLPYLSKKYDVALIDVRSAWKEYLIKNHLKQRDLLIDDIHLNADGNRVMASIYEDFFKKNQTVKRIAPKNETFLLANKDLKLQNNTLITQCSGQRMQATINRHLLKKNDKLLKIDIFVDGKQPSSYQSAYGFTRVSSYPNSNWPALLRVTKGETPLIVEQWKAKIFPKDDALKNFDFEVYGSITGFDGRGNALSDFVSNSKRIKILAQDWNLAFAYSVYKKKLPENFEISWRSEFRGNDQLNNIDVSEWNLLQDIQDGTHQIKFIGEGLQAIDAVRCFDK